MPSLRIPNIFAFVILNIFFNLKVFEYFDERQDFSLWKIRNDEIARIGQAFNFAEFDSGFWFSNRALVKPDFFGLFFLKGIFRALEVEHVISAKRN